MCSFMEHNLEKNYGVQDEKYDMVYNVPKNLTRLYFYVCMYACMYIFWKGERQSFSALTQTVLSPYFL